MAQMRASAASNNNYDHGSPRIGPNGTWRVIAPTELGAQPYNPGGDMVMWTSSDEGQTWKKVKQLTHDPRRNHTFARRPLNAHPDFYALWADGNGREPEESSLYFTNQRGDHVWRLPAKMQTDLAKPGIAFCPGSKLQRITSHTSRPDTCHDERETTQSLRPRG
jgi:hypothetical protein